MLTTIHVILLITTIFSIFARKYIIMTSFDYSHILTKAVDELSDSQSYKGLFQQHKDE